MASCGAGGSLARRLMKAHEHPAPHQAIRGIEFLDKVIDIDQSPIGRTPRSNPATYTQLFTEIRNLMAQTPEARMRASGTWANSSRIGENSPV